MRQLIFSILLFLCPVANVAQDIYAQRDANTGKYGLIKNGRWIIPAEYDVVYWDNEEKWGLVKKEKNGLNAIVNENGKIITGFDFSSAFVVSTCEGTKLQNLIEVSIDNNSSDALYGIIDRKGKIIVPCKYKSVILCEGFQYEKSGISVLTPDNKCGLLSLEGEVLIEPIYSSFISSMDFYNNKNFVVVNYGGGFDGKAGHRTVGGKWGVVNYTGDVVLPCEFDAIETDPFWELFFVNEGGNSDNEGNIFGGKWGLYDKMGSKLVECSYDGIESASESLYAVNKGGTRQRNGQTTGGKWGLYANGKEIVACQFDNAPEFKNDVATVKINGQVKLLKNPLKDGSQIQIASGDKSSDKKGKGPVVSRYPAPDSDVDKNIPTAKVSADNTFAFIIANENYPDAPVPYSLNDGRMFKEYCQKALGLPEKNINLYEDATFGNIITAVEKMKQIADAYDGDASVIFYYAGHGFPDEKQNTAYLLPIDGNASDITTTGYSMAKLYKELAAMKLKYAVVFLDACFSGAKREDQMFVQSRGVAIKVKNEIPDGSILVFSAAQGDETAHQMEEKHHGLFTYFLLKELQATEGDVDMGTLTEYVTKQVKRQSVVINNKKQTPTVIPSQALSSSWQSMKLK